MRRKKLVMGLVGGFGAVILGAGLVMYFVTGVGEYDLPPAALRLGENHKAAEAAGIWKTAPAPPKGSVKQRDFYRDANTFKTRVPKLPDATTVAQARSQRSFFAAEVKRAKSLAALPGIEWDYANRFLFTNPGVKQPGTLLAYDAGMAAASGEDEEAFSSLQDAINYAKLLASADTTTEILMAVAVRGFIQQSAVYCAGIWSHDPDRLKRLSAMLKEPVWAGDLGTHLRAEEYSNRLMIEGIDFGEPWPKTENFNHDFSAGDYSEEEEKAERRLNIRIPAKLGKDAMLSYHFGRTRYLYGPRTRGRKRSPRRRRSMRVDGEAPWFGGWTLRAPMRGEPVICGTHRGGMRCFRRDWRFSLILRQPCQMIRMPRGTS